MAVPSGAGMKDDPPGSFLAARAELNVEEQEWHAIEPAWADFLHAARTGNRTRSDRPGYIGGESFGSIHNALEVNRSRYEGGDPYHLLVALSTCAKSGTPMPYWVADGLLDVVARLNSEPASLHELFDAEKYFPTTSTKAITSREKQQLEVDIYVETSSLADQQPDSMSVEAALDIVLEMPKFKGRIGKSTARRMYEERKKLQNEYMAATRAGQPPPPKLPSDAERDIIRHVRAIVAAKRVSIDVAATEALSLPAFSDVSSHARILQLIRAIDGHG